MATIIRKAATLDLDKELIINDADVPTPVVHGYHATDKSVDKAVVELFGAIGTLVPEVVITVMK